MKDNMKVGGLLWRITESITFVGGFVIIGRQHLDIAIGISLMILGALLSHQRISNE